MSFFHNLNKKLDGIAARPESAQLNERDEGKPGKNFEKIAKSAAERYGSKEAGERVAGAVRNKLKAQGKLEEEGMSRAAKGYEKYGREGMQALANAGREGKDLDKVRAKYDKYDESIEEGLGNIVKKMGGAAKKLGSKALDTLGHGSDADLIRDLQKRMGMPQTGMKPTEPKEGNEFSGELQQARASGAKSFDVDGKEYPVKEAGMTPKQKSFAALAEPKNKITFADKIAGAKKEVDEMLGDVAAEAMRSALGGGRGRNAEMDEEASQGNAFTAHKRPRVEQPPRGSVEHGRKHDIKHDTTDPKYSGRIVTRRVDPSGISVGADDEAAQSGEKRGRGRPKGPAKGPERVTANATTHKGGRKVKEDENVSDEIKQAMAMLKKAGYQVSKDGEQELDEKAVSKKQQKFMGMVHAAQEGEKPASEEVAKTAKSMGKKDAEDFAATKHKGLPEKKKSESKENQSKDSDTDSKEDAPKKSKSKFKFGGSVYEALDAQLETLITEGMSVSGNLSQNDDGHQNKSITVNADGEDADRLAELLKMAGMEQHSNSCSSCGASPCGCDMIDENNPNWPTDTETSDNALQYAGGLNGPKSTGQTVDAPPNLQDQRQGVMKEDLQAKDGEHYRSYDDFISEFDADSFAKTETHPAGREIRGYIRGKCVMSWEYDDESKTSGYGNYDMTILEDDELYDRPGINSFNRKPRRDQTDFSEIPGGNHPRSQNPYSDLQGDSQRTRLKTAIKRSLGKHVTPNLPESMASMLNRLDELSEGATMPKTDPAINLDVLDPDAVVNRGLGRSPKEKIKTRLGRNAYGDLNAAAGEPRSRYYADKPNLPEQGVAEGLNEFAPGNGGSGGEDPYKAPKPQHYRRSSNYFEQFEADHFDREDFDDATGVFKGYWGSDQIAGFKFDDPSKTGSDDPGTGWYYEPQNEGVAEGAGQTEKKSPAEWLRDPRLETQVDLLQATGLSLDNPAKGFQSFDNFREPDSSQASNPMYFKEFLTAFARVPGAMVTAVMSAVRPQPAMAEGATPTPGLQPDGKYYNKAGRLIGTWNGRTFTVDPAAKQYWIDEFGEEEAANVALKWQERLKKETAPSENSIKYHANELEKSDVQAGRPRQTRQQYYDLAVQMLSGQQGVAESARVEQRLLDLYRTFGK